MKKASRAPAYACIYHGLSEQVRKFGYTLAIHGSMARDLDVIAIPWTDEAVSAEKIRDIIISHAKNCGLTSSKENFTEKPHGRLAMNIYLEAGATIDLSIMPRII